MKLRISLILAIGSVGLMMIRRLVEASDEADLQEQTEAQLQALRAHLFRP